MLYFFRQRVSLLLTPPMVSATLAVSALVLRLLGRSTNALRLLVGAVLFAYLCSISVVSDGLIGTLERRYPPLAGDSLPSAVGYVVVLGSSYQPRDGIPVTAALDSIGLARIVEGIRLVRRLGAARLVVSGGSLSASDRPAQGYATLARDLGVAEESLIVLDSPLDTAGEARSVAALLQNQPFILVTSAYHMPRAMRRMELVSAQPIPAPTGQLARAFNGRDWRRWLPNSAALRKTELAVHEYLGTVALYIGID